MIKNNIDYEKFVINENIKWQNDMKKKPKASNIIAKGVQNKINNVIPENIHIIFTEAIKNMVKVVLKGSEITSEKPYISLSLREREYILEEKFEFYRKGATLTGAGIGAGGFIIGFADIPSLLTIKMKFLFEMAVLYGYDVKNFKERLFILYIFKLAFSSDEKRKDIYYDIYNWEEISKTIPENFEDFNWREFQQEYRDYMDISKLLQFIPVVGAAFGAAANYKLLNRLYYVGKNSYRLRVLKQKELL